MDTAEFLFPHDLAVSDTGIRKVLLIGSCLAEAYLAQFRTLAPQVGFDWLLFNNPTELPALGESVLQSYDFQYVQLSLRHVVRDDVVNFGGFVSEGAAEAMFARSRSFLQLMLDSALQYNRSHGLLTFVSSFSVPQAPVVASLDQIGSVRDFSDVVRRLNEELATLVRQYTHVYIADVDAIGNSLGKRYFLDDVVGFYAHAHYWGTMNDEYDTSAEHNAPPSGRIDPLPSMADVYTSKSDEMFQAVWRQAECLYRTIQQIDMVKLVIFDLDDTLWRGQIAEHYGEGVAIPVLHGWVAGMWEAVQHLRARGFITALCSKNDAGLVAARWHRAVGLPWLALDDFPLREINWRPKAENVASIIRQASVTARSTVFVDDNPVERESVRAALPGIRILGANPHTTRRILLWSPETQLAFRSTETAGREQSIRQLQVRENDRSALSREDFLRTLGCAVTVSEIATPQSPDFARGVELLNKTNQFNTTGIRWTSVQITAFLSVQGRIFTFRVKDIYTDYGLVGTILYRLGLFAQVAMSCRVLGLGIETSVIHAIMQSMRAEGQTEFCARVIETDANIVCRDLFSRCGYDERRDDSSLHVWSQAAIPPVAAHLQMELAIMDPQCA